MTQRTDAYPELDRDLRFFPLGVEQPRQLSAGQIQQYNDKGYIFPIDIFSKSEIEVIRATSTSCCPRRWRPAGTATS